MAVLTYRSIAIVTTSMSRELIVRIGQTKIAVHIRGGDAALVFLVVFTQVVLVREEWVETHRLGKAVLIRTHSVQTRADDIRRWKGISGTEFGVSIDNIWNKKHNNATGALRGGEYNKETKAMPD